MKKLGDNLWLLTTELAQATSESIVLKDPAQTKATHAFLAQDETRQVNSKHHLLLEAIVRKIVIPHHPE